MVEPQSEWSVCCLQSRVLSSSNRSSYVSGDGILSLDLASLLSVLSNTESTLQGRCKELQVSHTDKELFILQLTHHGGIDQYVCVAGGGAISAAAQ